MHKLYTFFMLSFDIKANEKGQDQKRFLKEFVAHEKNKSVRLLRGTQKICKTLLLVSTDKVLVAMI